MKIKIDIEICKVKVKSVNHNSGTPVSHADIDQIYQNQGFRHVGTVLYAESSPRCLYYVIGGWAVRVYS
jgi:hypothetical protein